MAVDMGRPIVETCSPEQLCADRPNVLRFASEPACQVLGRDPRWVPALCEGLGHDAHVLTVKQRGELAGVLPLVLVKSNLFGRFLVSLPYVNSSGILANDPSVARELVDAAIQLADQFDVKYLELRQEAEVQHPRLTEQLTSKVHMRLALPATAEELLGRFKSKLRSQIRNGEKKELAVSWGGAELLNDFYTVFARNMRDLGTPVYGRQFFRSILKHFQTDVEFCVVRKDGLPIAAGMLVHGQGITEVPSASSLREHNASNANMVLYWNLLKRTIERGQRVFDFGRSDKDGPHFKFKEQWGAQPHPAIWQYYVRRGSPGDMRPKSAKYQFLIRTWQKLPLRLANAVGPTVVRGIP